MDFGETKCEIFEPDNKTKLLARIWLPKNNIKAIFIGIHGGMAHGGDWVTPANYFMKKDVATYALDLRHHGAYPQYNKGGKNFFHIDSYDVYSNDIHAFYHWVKERHPDIPIFIIAHSNGALISLNYGLSMGKDTDIRGYILSSPWLENKVVVSKIIISLSKIIAAVAPTFSVAPEPVTDHLTHDQTITKRHYEDEKKGLRGTKASVKLGVECMKTQKWVIDNMRNWKTFPIFCVIAGKDMLAVPETSEKALSEAPKDLVNIIKYNDNYHENFNEINREEIFGLIWDWAEKLL